MIVVFWYKAIGLPMPIRWNKHTYFFPDRTRVSLFVCPAVVKFVCIIFEGGSFLGATAGTKIICAPARFSTTLTQQQHLLCGRPPLQPRCWWFSRVRQDYVPTPPFGSTATSHCCTGKPVLSLFLGDHPTFTGLGGAWVALDCSWFYFWTAETL